jgi:hypothetical protein
MKVVVHHQVGIKWHKRYLEYFTEGFRKHGIRVTASSNPNTEPCDVAVLFGPNYWKNIERTHPQYLMVNRKFIGDVNDVVTIGWNGLNGRGVFCVDEVNPKRLRRHIFDIDPWREPVNGHTLLLGQFDVGRCGKYTTLEEWYRYVRSSTGDSIAFRAWPGGRSLSLDCVGARMAVTLNSTVAIETVLLGIPTVTCDEGSPAWPICAHHLGHVKRSDNRLQWLEYLSNCQWEYHQIKNGDFWRQLWPIKGPRLCDVEL